MKYLMREMKYLMRDFVVLNLSIYMIFYAYKCHVILFYIACN